MSAGGLATKEKRWHQVPCIPPSVERSLREYHRVLAQVLYNRGFQDSVSAKRFLRGDMSFPDPFNLIDMDRAVGRIRAAIKRKESIVVYGDFDTDGVTSTVLLVQTLKALGAIVRPYIPHRVDEGYGLNSAALTGFARRGDRVVITVDCGIRAIEEVRVGTAAGLDIIVTDHHSVGPRLPDAFAVVNPKRSDCKYGEDMLAGVGIAFRLADALLRAAAKNDKHSPDMTTEDLLDLVAIGTVADLAPLNRLENRVLVQRGLEVVNAARRPGIHALLVEVGLRPGTIKALNISFGIGPRLNAAGRLDSAMTAYDLLDTSDYTRAVQLARELNDLNAERQVLTRDAEELAREQAQRDIDTEDLPLLFAESDTFLPGIVGLVAGRLAEEFYRPAVVIELGKEESRGSCRSIPEFDIIQALDECADLLVRHGGHAQAAGFSILNENLPLLQERLMKFAVDALSGQDLRPELIIDSEVPFEQLTLELATELAQLEPTGHENPKPLLMTRGIPVADHRAVGRESAHLKLRFGEFDWYIDGIAFRQGAWAGELPRRVDVAYHLEVNEWNGRRRAQLNVQDIRPAG